MSKKLVEVSVLIMVDEDMDSDKVVKIVEDSVSFDYYDGMELMEANYSGTFSAEGISNE